MDLQINTDQYLARFRVHNPTSLFPPDFSLLSKNKCPICGRKLYGNVKKTMFRCKSKQKDKFIITSGRLLSLGGSLK